MQGPTCIVWANLIPFSLERQCDRTLIMYASEGSDSGSLPASHTLLVHISLSRIKNAPFDRSCARAKIMRPRARATSTKRFVLLSETKILARSRPTPAAPRRARRRDDRDQLGGRRAGGGRRAADRGAVLLGGRSFSLGVIRVKWSGLQEHDFAARG